MSKRPKDSNNKKHSKLFREKKAFKPNNYKGNLDPDEIRLNKFISNSGVCTRKEADLYISTGSVKVNGKIVTEMGHKVKVTDEVRFDGQLIKPVKKVYILLNKPKGFTIENNTANSAKTVYSLTNTASKGMLKPVGKMERNASGLLILSNDETFLGSMNGSNKITQLFHVELDKPFNRADFDKVLNGVRLDENILKVNKISYVEDKKREIGIELNSQKNRVVTRIFENLGYKINFLDRVTVGGLTKKDLPRGKWRTLTKQEIINLQMMS